MFQNLKTRVGNMAAALKKYNPLLIELVSRDIKVRYRKSVLGMLWTVRHHGGVFHDFQAEYPEFPDLLPERFADFFV